MISDFKLITEPIPDLSNHTKCLDRLISIGSLAYNPEENKVNGSFINEGVGLFLIHSSVFCQYFTITKTPYPIYPTLNRGIANNVSKHVYDSIKQMYKLCKSMVDFDFNTVNFNIGKTSIYKHTHKFASPLDDEINTQVFAFQLTNFNTSNRIFKLHGDEYFELPLNSNCTFKFNGMIEHEVTNINDNNYYGYFVFERWKE